MVHDELAIAKLEGFTLARFFAKPRSADKPEDCTLHC